MECVIFEPWVKNVAEGIENKMPDLRDLFAMNALNGMCVHHDGDSDIDTWDYDRIAVCAYAAADAMLKVRNKK